MRGGLSPVEARRLVGHDDRTDQNRKSSDLPVDGPSRRSAIVARTALAMVIVGLGLTMCASPRAADRYPPGQYAIWLFHAAAPHENPDLIRIYKISGDYENRETCLQVLQSVTLKAPKAVARCLPVEPRSDR